MRKSLRILFTFAGGEGHLDPMLPLATSLRSAGHQTALAGDARVARRIANFDPVFGHRSGDDLDADQSTGELLKPDLEHELQVIGSYFVAVLGRKNAERIGDVIAEWKPDIVISDEMDFGAQLAAELAGIPRVTVKVIAAGSLTRPEYVVEALAEIRESLGLEPDPDLNSLNQDLVIAPFPASFRDPAFPLPRNSLLIRPESPASASTSEAVDWLRSGAAEHRIYFTLGTIFNTESGDLFARVLDGLRQLPARVLATVGPNIDPQTIPISAPNVRIERYVPQQSILPHVDLVVNHGGSGSVIGALAQGVPLVVLPLGADQQLNAERVSTLSVGAVLDPIVSTSDDISAAASSQLSSRETKFAALSVMKEIKAMSSAASALARIQQLAVRDPD